MTEMMWLEEYDATAPTISNLPSRARLWYIVCLKCNWQCNYETCDFCSGKGFLKFEKVDYTKIEMVEKLKQLGYENPEPR